MLSREGKERTFAQNAILAISLSAVAGAVNATGFLVVGTYTSHVTGNLARAGDELAQRNFALAWEFFAMVVAFLSGAIVSTLLVELTRRSNGRGRFAAPLILELLLLATFTFLSALDPQHRASDLQLTLILCSAMGLQNALVTTISGAVVRTTHLTGITTDFGIELVRIFFWWRDLPGGFWWKVRRLPLLPKDPALRQTWLHFAIFNSFFAAAIVGPMLFFAYGSIAMAMPVAILFGLLFYELWRRMALRPDAATESS